jgi:ATP-dependent exoDNAse (exonuclease V) beta subunit
MSKHISFSALKMWNECPFKYKLNYVDNIGKFSGNEYTAFGTALHEACEKKLLNNSEDEIKVFSEAFERELLTLPPESSLDQKLINEMKEQGRALAPMVLPAVKEKFGNFTMLAAEEDLYEKLENVQEWSFKGFIDLIIKTEDGRIHILDWKSCAWGWDSKKKSDPMTTYQLTFYKHFYAKKHNIKPEDIETHFALLKRTAKKDNVEIFRVTSGDKKTQNAFNLLTKALYAIDKGFYPKNRLNCKYCEFSKTKDCP